MKAKSIAYYIVLVVLGVGFLGPLAGLSAAYMNFKLGFYLGGSVLAGVLGSVVTILHGAQGRHGANYIQTLASAVGSLGGMSTIIQTMHWLGMPEPSAWKMILLFLGIGMFSTGVGVMFTPLLVDRWRLEFPSGKAVADLLRALTDPYLLRRSAAKLGGGMLIGFVTGRWPAASAAKIIPGSLGVLAANFSAAVLGAGLIVGARIALPALVMGLIGLGLTPWLRSIGWLEPGQKFRAIGFLFGLAMILGAAAVHLGPILWNALLRLREERQGDASERDAGDASRGESSVGRGVILWTCAWAGVVAFTAGGLLDVNWGFVALALSLSFVFVLINGISTGISDSNPISAAFVLSVLLFVVAGLKGAMVGLLAGAIVMMSATLGVDMQQDRSTGRRLGSDRRTQFYFQVLGVLVGAPFAVFTAKFFFASFPELLDPTLAAEKGWQSAMSLKLTGVLQGIGGYKPRQMQALALGLAFGFIVALLRRVLRKPDEAGRPRFSRNRAVDFTLDAIILPTPFASSFGAFFTFPPTAWFGLGGVLGSVWNTAAEKHRASQGDAKRVPEDMTDPSLLGGGLIAGETLAYVVIGLTSMAGTFF